MAWEDSSTTRRAERLNGPGSNPLIDRGCMDSCGVGWVHRSRPRRGGSAQALAFTHHTHRLPYRNGYRPISIEIWDRGRRSNQPRNRAAGLGDSTVSKQRLIGEGERHRE